METIITEVDPSDKKAFEDLCSSNGLTVNDVLVMFIKETLRERCFPLDTFNSKVNKAMKEADEIENGTLTPKVFKDTKSLFEGLDKENDG